MAQVPTARTVKHRGVVVTPRGLPWRARFEAWADGLGDGPRSFLAAVVGLWPVTAVVGAGFGICWLAMIG